MTVTGELEIVPCSGIRDGKNNLSSYVYIPDDEKMTGVWYKASYCNVLFNRPIDAV